MTTLLTATITETGGLRQLVMESLAGGSGSESNEAGLDLGAALSFLTPQDRAYLSQQLTPPGWAEDQMAALTAGVYEWIDNDRAQPELSVDIGPLKVALLAGGAADLVEIVVDSWPSCTVAQMAEMGVGALLGEQNLVLCEPPEPLRSGLVGILNISISASLRAMPDRLTLSRPGAYRPASAEMMATKERIRTVRAVAAWSWLVSPALLGLVMGLVIRTWRGLALWWGIPLMLGALLALATMVGVRLLVDQGFRAALAETELPGWVGGMVQSLVVAMMVVIFRRVAVQSVSSLSGVVLFVVGRLARLPAGHPRRPMRGLRRLGTPPARPPPSGSGNVKRSGDPRVRAPGDG
jgi:hypothetical protein